MSLSSVKLDAGDIWMREDLDLKGKNMKEVFHNISSSSIKLLNRFIDEYPNIQPQEQNSAKGSYYKRRTNEESQILKSDFTNWDLKTIYNFIRSLTDPYPNAFLEDEMGNKLIFKEVEFIPKNTN
jgi:methionyl-tRNA formyltransferase